MLNTRKRNRSSSSSYSRSSPLSSKDKNLLKNNIKESFFKLMRYREMGMIKRPRRIFDYDDTTLYNISYNSNINTILEYNPKIELYKFTILPNKKVIFTIHNNLSINDDIQGQYLLYDEDNRQVLHTFTLYGKDRINPKRNRFILDDMNRDNLYVNENVNKFYLFENNLFDSKNIESDNEIYKEYLSGYNIKFVKDNIDYTLHGDNEVEKMKDENYKFFHNITKELESRSKSRSKSNSRSDSISKSSSEYQQYKRHTLSNGGKLTKNIDKTYMKKLRNKSLEKLQNMAKNKKIKYTKMLNGKKVPIKKETLIKKLCKNKKST